MRRPGALVILLTIAPTFAAEPDVAELVRRSVANNERNWKAAPEYSFTERDLVTNGDKTTSQTYRVTMIDGSQYNQLLEENGEPLKGERAAAEKRKAEQEGARRRSENSSARAGRVAQYQRERSQDRALMSEMAKAFDFKLAGRESINGRDCYVLDASPRAGYRPTSRQTKVLTGMRGRMWIDSKEYQWVKVHAEVFRPVPFGLFFAHVRPGTEFTLEEVPIGGGLWMPSRLITKVRATAILVWSRKMIDDETYSDYRRSGTERAAIQTSPH
jgi:hypothetical protein